MTPWQITTIAVWGITLLLAALGALYLSATPRGFAVLKEPETLGAIGGWMTGLLGLTFWTAITGA